VILFLDSNVLIYLIEGDELLVAQVQQTIQRYRAAHSEIVIADRDERIVVTKDDDFVQSFLVKILLNAL